MKAEGKLEGATAQMRAWICHAFGDYRGLECGQRAIPQPAPGEALVRVRAFAPGFPDMLMTQGLYQLKPALPFTPCAEFAGEVAALGVGVEGLAIGQQVMGVARFGAAADFICWKAAELLPVPPAFDFGTAAAYLVAYKTAWVGLVVRGGLQPGEILLVLGAAGGVGLAAVELGKRLGATVIASASTPEKRAAATAMGADHVLDATEPRFRDQVKALTNGRGADVIYDPVGGDAFDEALHCIAPFGRVLVIGFASGRIPSVSVNYALIKQIAIIGVRAGEYGRLNPSGGSAVNAALAERAAQGEFHPHVHRRFRFDELLAAFDEIAERRVIGRIVVET